MSNHHRTLRGYETTIEASAPDVALRRRRIYPPLLVAGCLIVAAILIWYISRRFDTDQGAMLSLPVLASAPVLLSFGGAAALDEHWGQPRLLLLILLASIGATVTSGVNGETYQGYGGGCSPTFHLAGLPFPWDPLIPTRDPECLGLLREDPNYLHHLRIASSGLGPLFFVLDTMFYGAIMLAIVELYEAFLSRTKSSTSRRHSNQSR